MSSASLQRSGKEDHAQIAQLHPISPPYSCLLQLPFPLGTMDNSRELSISLRRMASMKAFSRSAQSETRALARDLLRRLPLVPDAAGRFHFHAVLHALVEQASTIPPLGTGAHAIVVDASATPSFSPWRPRWWCQRRSQASADPAARAADTLRFVTAMGPRSTLEVVTEASAATQVTATALEMRSFFGRRGEAVLQLSETAANAALAIGLASPTDHPHDVHVDVLGADGDELSVVPEEEPSPTRGSLTSPAATEQARVSPNARVRESPDPLEPAGPSPPLRIGSTVHRSIWDRSPVQHLASGLSSHSSARDSPVPPFAQGGAAMLRMHTSSLKGQGPQRMRTGSGSLSRGSAIQRLHTTSGSLVAARDGPQTAGAADRTAINMLHSGSASARRRPAILTAATGGAAADSPLSASPTHSPIVAAATEQPVLQRAASLRLGVAGGPSFGTQGSEQAGASAAPRVAPTTLRETFEQRRAAMSAISNRFLARQRSLRMMPSPTARGAGRESVEGTDSLGRSPRNDSMGRPGRNDSLGRPGRNDSVGRQGRSDSHGRSPRLARTDSLDQSPQVDFMLQQTATPVLASLGPAGAGSNSRAPAAAAGLGLPRATRSLKAVTPRSPGTLGVGASLPVFAASARSIPLPSGDAARAPGVGLAAVAAVPAAATAAPPQVPSPLVDSPVHKIDSPATSPASSLAAAPSAPKASPGAAAFPVVPPNLPPSPSAAPAPPTPPFPVRRPTTPGAAASPAAATAPPPAPSARSEAHPPPATPASRSAISASEAAAVLLSARARAALELVLATSVADGGDEDESEDLPGSVG